MSATAARFSRAYGSKVIPPMFEGDQKTVTLDQIEVWKLVRQAFEAGFAEGTHWEPIETHGPPDAR